MAYFSHWSSVHANQLGSLSSANLPGNSRPSTNLEIISGWHIRAVTTTGIKLTCLQCWEACQIPAVVSMNLPNGTWINLWKTSSLSVSPRASQPVSESQPDWWAVAGVIRKLLACWFPTPSLGLCKTASPFCPQKTWFIILSATGLLDKTGALNFLVAGSLIGRYSTNFCWVVNECQHMFVEVHECLFECQFTVSFLFSYWGIIDILVSDVQPSDLIFVYSRVPLNNEYIL